MSAPPFDAGAVIDAMAPLLGLDIRHDHRPGVAHNLGVAARMAALVLDGSLGDHADPAPFFVPGDTAAAGRPAAEGTLS